MNVNDVKAQIKNNQLNHFYIFTGDEYTVQRIYIQHIAQTSNLDIKYIDTISDVWADITAKGFLKTSNCYVVRDDDKIIQNDSVQDVLSTLKDDIVILLLTSIDKRTKFFKKHKELIVEFNTLKEDILIKYIQNDIKLTTQLCKQLISVCNNNYGNCLLEIDKVKQYAKDDKDVNKVFTDFLDNGTIHTPPKDAIFDFVDAILDADCKLAFNLYDECIACGESIMVMLSVLYTNTKQLLQVQSYNGNNLEKATGLTKWQINNARKHINVFSNRELINIMRLCSQCERDIKTGIVEEQDTMKYILSTIEW